MTKINYKEENERIKLDMIDYRKYIRNSIKGLSSNKIKIFFLEEEIKDLKELEEITNF